MIVDVDDVAARPFTADEMSDLADIDKLPNSQKFLAHVLMATRGKVRDMRLNKPFQDWTFADIKAAVARYARDET